MMMIAADKSLIDAALADYSDDESRARVLAEIRNPDWSCLVASGGDPDWGDYIPDVIADRWDDLPADTKLMLFIVAHVAIGRSPGRYDYE
jgi:hypothetical protein